MRGSHLHNRFRAEPSGLPGELNHVHVIKGDGRELLRSHATDKDHPLFGASLDFYKSIEIGTHDGNHTANWMVDMLDAGVEFIDTETVVEEESK